jgi:hypothetical protein
MENKDTAYFNVKYRLYPIYKPDGSVKIIFIIYPKYPSPTQIDGSFA